MKKDLNISRIAIVCVLCTAAVSGAYAASSVRSLGGSGTYTSASSAASAGSSGATTAVRGGSLRVTPSSGQSGSSTTISAGTTTSGRVATSPRLSIGQYLGGATSVSGGGSSLRPGTGSGSSGGGSSSGGGMDPDVAGEVLTAIDDIRRDVDTLFDADTNLQDQVSAKQDMLYPTANGFIIIDDSTNEIFVDVDALEQELELVAGREVELGSDDTDLLWRYVGDPDWQKLISKAEITGPQGPQGEKGEPGDAANLDAYSTTEQMNQAIGNAIAALADVYATKADVDALEREVVAKANMQYVNDELAKKANAADVYTKAEVYNKTEVDEKVADIVAGDMDEALANKADKTYVDEQLATKADKTELANKADASAVSALETEVGEINDLASDAALAAANAISGLDAKENISNKTQTVTNSATEYPSGAAVTAALAAKANVDDVPTTVAELTDASNYVTTDGLSGAISTATENMVTDTELTDALANKADKATTLAGYGITDAYTTAQIDEKLEDVAVGGMEGMEQVLAGKQDVSNLVQVVSETDTTKYPSGAAVYKELETKANASELDTLEQTVGQLDSTINAEGTGLADQIDAANAALAGKADASDVTGLETAVDALETTVGNGESGLVKDVADAKAAADKASQDVAGKQNALTAEQLNAVNSGITADKVSVYDDYADDIAGKQDALGYTAENSANKTDDMTADTGSTTKYPTVHAVEAYVTNTVAEGVEINTDQIQNNAVTTDKIADKAVTKEKLSDELNAEIDGKANTADLKALAYKEKIVDADVADDAAIEKSKLALDVQTALDNAANAVAAPAGEKAINSVLGTDGEGNPVWYEIVFDLSE